jgi:hypothetical protein
LRPGCHAAADIDGGAQALVAAVSALPGASPAEPVTLGGRSGLRIRLDPVPGRDGPPCAGEVVLREFSLRVVMASQFPGWSSVIWAVDVDDHLVVVAASHGPDVTPAEEQELVGIVESLSFVLP